MGDAAFGITGRDCETAVRCKVPILSVVLNNSTMAIEIPHMKLSHEKLRSRDLGGNYAALARELGRDGRRGRPVSSSLSPARRRPSRIASDFQPAPSASPTARLKRADWARACRRGQRQCQRAECVPSRAGLPTSSSPGAVAGRHSEDQDSADPSAAHC
jgi:hypothetical protein